MITDPYTNPNINCDMLEKKNVFPVWRASNLPFNTETFNKPEYKGNDLLLLLLSLLQLFL